MNVEMKTMYIFSFHNGEMKQNPQLCRWREDKNPAFFPVTLYMYTTFKEKENQPKKSPSFGAYHVGQLVLLMAPQLSGRSGFSQDPKIKKKTIKQ